MAARRRVLVTRPLEDAAPLAARLEADGFTTLTEPLFQIRYFDNGVLELDGVQALAFTSANGVRAFVHNSASALDKDLSVFAVGPATAQAARAAGFGDVRDAGGDGAALARLIIGDCPPGAGAVLHVAGSTRAGDLVGELQGAGITARRAILYDTVAADTLSPGLCREIEAHAIDAVLIFSPRTAELFVTLMVDAGLAPLAQDMVLVALSPAVSEAAPLPWGAVKVAGAPDQAALLAALAEAAQGD